MKKVTGLEPGSSSETSLDIPFGSQCNSTRTDAQRGLVRSLRKLTFHPFNLGPSNLANPRTEQQTVSVHNLEQGLPRRKLLPLVGVQRRLPGKVRESLAVKGSRRWNVMLVDPRLLQEVARERHALPGFSSYHYSVLHPGCFYSVLPPGSQSLPTISGHYEDLQQNQEDWGWFIWFCRGRTALAVDVFCDDPAQGAFRVHLTSRHKRWLLFDQVVDTPELEELREVVVRELEAWAGSSCKVTRLDSKHMPVTGEAASGTR